MQEKVCPQCGSHNLTPPFRIHHAGDWYCHGCGGQWYDKDLVDEPDTIDTDLTEIRDFVTLDSGERVEWETGSRRDTNEGKPRYDLIGVIGLSRYLENELDSSKWTGMEKLCLTEMLNMQLTSKHNRKSYIDSIVARVFGMMEGLDEKPEYIPVKALRGLAELMQRGAEKYGEHNWTLGQPTSRSYESALRHYMQYLNGDTDENHLAAVAFNMFSIQHVMYQITLGELPSTLDDMYYL